MDSIPGLGRSPGGGHGNPLQYSCLENPTKRGAWPATVHRITKGWTGHDGATQPKCTDRSLPFHPLLPPPLSEPSSPFSNGLLTLLPAYCLQTILTPLAQDIAKILLSLSFLFFLWFTEQRLQDNDLQGNSLNSILGCLQVHQLTVRYPSAQKHWLEQAFSYTYQVEKKLPQIFAAPADSKQSLSIPS